MTLNPVCEHVETAQGVPLTVRKINLNCFFCYFFVFSSLYKLFFPMPFSPPPPKQQQQKPHTHSTHFFKLNCDCCCCCCCCCCQMHTTQLMMDAFLLRASFFYFRWLEWLSARLWRLRSCWRQPRNSFSARLRKRFNWPFCRPWKAICVPFSAHCPSKR